MDSQELDLFFEEYGSYLSADKIMYLKDKMKMMDKKRLYGIYTLKMTNPRYVFIVSVFPGIFGVDRFLIGDTHIGLLKLLTLGGCGILLVTDWLTIAETIRDLNFNVILEYLKGV